MVRKLAKLSAFGAIAGGVLRIISSFIPFEEGHVGLEAYYALIDLFLIFGLSAVYLTVASYLGWSGLMGFTVAIMGLASIVGPDPVVWGVDFYRLGAAVLMLGLAGLSLQMLRARVMKQAALFWLGAFATGILSTLTGSPFVFAIAGMLFGLGFVSAGLDAAHRAESVFRQAS